MTTERFTRQQYLARPNEPWVHRRYYAQLVNDRTIAAVVQAIGRTRLLTIQSLSDIPLQAWDHLCGFAMVNYGYARGDMTQLSAPAFPLAQRFEELNDYPTQAGLVCVAKEAALQYVEREREAARAELEEGEEA